MTAINKFNTSMIYSIRSNATDKYYIGSTTQILCKRFSDHKMNYKDYLKGTSNFVTSFKILELGNAYIELLEDVNCENRNQLEKREGELIREHKNNCVNKNIPGRTKNEWYIDNKKSISEQKKEYRINNKEEITKQKKQYYVDNKESMSKKNKQYQIDNKDKLIQYRIENKDKLIQYRIDNKDKAVQYAIDNNDKIAEYQKQYRLDNKDKAIQYRIDNIESMKAKAKQQYLCACGLTIRTDSKAKHIKSAKHIKALEQEIIII